MWGPARLTPPAPCGRQSTLGAASRVGLGAPWQASGAGRAGTRTRSARSRGQARAGRGVPLAPGSGGRRTQELAAQAQGGLKAETLNADGGSSGAGGWEEASVSQKSLYRAGLCSRPPGGPPIPAPGAARGSVRAGDPLPTPSPRLPAGKGCRTQGPGKPGAAGRVGQVAPGSSPARQSRSHSFLLCTTGAWTEGFPRL